MGCGVSTNEEWVFESEEILREIANNLPSTYEESNKRFPDD
jgi:hypothetical protein